MKKKIDLEIDYMRECDLKDVMWIERKSFRTPWTGNTFRRELEDDNDFSHFMVGRHKNKTIAFIGFTHVLDEAHILTFAVHPKYRRRGVGTQLLTYTLNMAKTLGAKKVTLEVRVSNISAQSLYKRFGFQTIAIRKRFYPDTGEDGYLMCLSNLNDVYYANNEFSPLESKIQKGTSARRS